MKLNEEQRARLREGLSTMRDAEKQKKEVQGRDDVLAIQVIKGKGFTNLIFDAYGSSEAVYTIDDASFGLFVGRLAAVSEKPMGHDMFMFQRYDDMSPQMEDQEECEDTNSEQ